MASLIDAALGKKTKTSPRPSPQAQASATVGSSTTGPIWGSFERNTGTWTPYSRAESESIEATFAAGVAEIEVPSCFNAVALITLVDLTFQAGTVAVVDWISTWPIILHADESHQGRTHQGRLPRR